jgi:uncharacterized phage infection (PIP) family protein YhgE
MRRLTSTALPGIMLVIVILWALTAVIFLTGILAAANRIESRVAGINSSLTPISSKLNTVPILTKVQDTANEIRDTAAPLSTIIGRIADSAASIDGSLKSVNAVVGPINESAKSINASVLTINQAVNTIGPNLETILGNAREINATVHSIDGELATVLDNVYDIRSRVVTATNQADDINRSAKAIDGDTTVISNIVGTAGFRGTVNGNAYAIEKNPLLLDNANAGVFKEMVNASARQDPAAAQAGIPSFDLLPQIAALGMPALPALPTTDVPSVLTNLLGNLPVLSDTGDLLGQVVVAPK